MYTYLFLCSLFVAGVMIAIFSKNLIRSAVASGLGSTALAMMFFQQGAPYAGGFELSVGAGLISVLFIVAISYTDPAGGGQDGS